MGLIRYIEAMAMVFYLSDDNYSKNHKIDTGSGRISKAIESSNIEMNALSLSLKGIIGVDASIGIGNRKK